jgi:hypothetical protein
VKAPTAVALRSCNSSEVRLTVDTVKHTHRVVDQVMVVTTITNMSSHACVVPTRTTFTIFDNNGQPRRTGVSTVEYEGDAWGPGDVIDNGFSWNQDCAQLDCVGGLAPRGEYRVEAVWSTGADYPPVSSWFQLS